MNKATISATSGPQGEALSSLMDGELRASDAGSLITLVCSDKDLRGEWVAFHVVGDALRSTEVASAHCSAFCARVANAIAAEPTVLAPRPLDRAPSSLRRYLAPSLAVAASVAVIGFVAVPLMRESPPTTPIQQAASEPAPVALSAAETTTRRAAATVANARAMQAYLAAHRELATGAALPRATPYLRTTTEQPEGR